MFASNICENFLQVSTAQEESHRMTSVRKVYQRAIVTPTHHVEELWKDYENFENSVSRALVIGLLSTRSLKYTYKFFRGPFLDF